MKGEGLIQDMFQYSLANQMFTLRCWQEMLKKMSKLFTFLVPRTIALRGQNDYKETFAQIRKFVFIVKT